jgi:hypothetical protein
MAGQKTKTVKTKEVGTMKKMNQKQAEAYIEGGGKVCPFCGDSNISTGNIDPDGGVLTQAVECQECKAEWSDVFRLVAVYDRETSRSLYPKKEEALDSLTAKDWVEIYYSLDSKAARVKDGEYSANKNHARKWSRHLREIMKKIGPDGDNITGGG